MTASHVDLLYVLSHGFAARMVLHSSLLPELHARGVRVALMADNVDKPYFREPCERRHAEAIAAPRVGGRLLAHYGQARRYLFEDYENNAALRAKHLWDMNQTSRLGALRGRAMLGKAVNSILLRAPKACNVLRGAEQSALRSPTLRALLQRVQPRMVVSTYPVAWLEALTVIEARRLGIRTVGHLLSWDNITCKGRFAGVPDHFVSWGPIMTDELVEHYGVSRSAIAETGVAHFDLHTRKVDPVAAASHLAKAGLDPSRPYLFFGMSASYFAPKEIDVVAWIARRVREGSFGRDMQFLVRPHPQNVRGPMADPAIISKLAGISGGPVAIDMPQVLSDGLDMAEQDMSRLSGLLHGAAVTLNSGSTLSIDAMIRDRPVILTMFDADETLPWWRSARRLEEFPHLKKLLSHGGIRVARSFEDLERLIRRYLDEPSWDRVERRRALEAECGAPDGRACVRIADALAELLSGPRPVVTGGSHELAAS